MGVVIRPVEGIEGAEHFRRLERMIWAGPPEDTVPVHMTITIVHNGGGLLGAYADDGPTETGGMVGLCFWWPGLGVPTTEEGRGVRFAPHPKMCSHMAGVHPAWQGLGLGLQLKLAQRQAILNQGFADWVTWTYDPLQRTNAVFNIRRLGALCNSYKVDWYGEMVDGLNAGTPSDRLQVDWWLRSRRVEERLDNPPPRAQGEVPAGTLVLPALPSAAGFQTPDDGLPALDGRTLALPIPEDIGAVRRADPSLAMAWRLAMRAWLTAAFAAGYVLTDCVHLPPAGWHYLLQRPTP